MAGPGQPFSMASQGSVQAPMMTSQGYTQSPGTTSAGLQHQQPFSGPVPSSTPQPPQMMSPTKSVNSVSLCKLGQETNQELVNKLLELFRHFKAMQLPNGSNNQMCQDRRAKIEESSRQLSIIFRKLRVIYDKVSELIVDPEDNPEEVLVPLKGEPLEEKNTNTDNYKYSSEEHKHLVEQVQVKNRQIKEVIDKIRTIMWEINTMIVMRKT